VLALRCTELGETCSVGHLQAMLALFGPVAVGQPVMLPETYALQAHAFKFEHAEHAEQACQVCHARAPASLPPLHAVAA
jgi:hypothetical protein